MLANLNQDKGAISHFYGSKISVIEIASLPSDYAVIVALPSISEQWWGVVHR
jgi:hypothetical protein